MICRDRGLVNCADYFHARLDESHPSTSSQALHSCCWSASRLGASTYHLDNFYVNYSAELTLYSSIVVIPSQCPFGALQPSARHPTLKSLSYSIQRYSSCSNAPSAEAPRAAALIIGNEILNGSVVDTNTPWLAKLLYRQSFHLS